MYILKIKFDSKDMLKIGKSENFTTSMMSQDTISYLEKEVKDRLRYCNEQVEIAGKRFTEIYFGETPEKADEIVQECARELEVGDDRSFQLRMMEEDRKIKEVERSR